MRSDACDKAYTHMAIQMERGCVVMASREERLEIQGYEASISCHLYPALEAVAYTPQDDGVRKDYV